MLPSRHIGLVLLLPLSLLTLSSCVPGLRLPGLGGDTVALPAFPSYTSCAVADLNGDGKLDIAVSYATIANAPPHLGSIVIYLQDPAHPGKFLPLAPVLDAGYDPTNLIAADLNGDGNIDLAVVNTNAAYEDSGVSGISVFLQDAANPGNFLAAAKYKTGFSPFAMAVGDLDGDGRLDLAVTDTTGISVFRQSSTAAGKFMPRITIPVSDNGAEGIAIADLNGDGRADIVTSAVDLMVFLQSPSSPGSFLSPVHYSAGAQPYAILVEDLNSDSHPDIAVANLGSPDATVPASLSVLLQDRGTGAFFPAASYSTGETSWTIASADLNGDGLPDLVVGNMGSYAGGSVSVFLQNTTPGTFKAADTYPDSGVIGWVCTGDMNGDGRQDIVIVSDVPKIRFQDPAHPGTFLDPIPLTN